MNVSERARSSGSSTPEYAVFDDYRATQGILVLVRWILIAYGAYVTNVRPTFDEAHTLRNNAIFFTVGLINAYLHWRAARREKIQLATVLFASVVDAAAITTILVLSESPALVNPYYIAYFPIVLSYALVFPRGLALGYSIAVAGAYGISSVLVPPGVDFGLTQEKVLVGRLLTILTAAVVGVLIVSGERALRLGAVEAERARAAENLELQRRTQEAEMRAQMEEARLRREIHDGVAQSAYMLSLQLETTAELVSRERPDLGERLAGLLRLAHQILLEVRHYLFDLKPLIAGEKSLVAMLQSQVKEFQSVTGLPVTLKASGEEPAAPVAAGAALYRIAQEALANVYRHAQASRIEVELAFDGGGVVLVVRDDGMGFALAAAEGLGHGLENMRQRARERGGTITIESGRGKGTEVKVELPLEGTSS